jgi:hypothetical protein
MLNRGAKLGVLCLPSGRLLRRVARRTNRQVREHADDTRWFKLRQR